MSYNTIVHMAHDGDLQQRFIACAAQEGIDQPDAWVLTNKWALVASDSQAVADYAYAMDLDNAGIGQYGKREDIINDAKLLAIVQARVAALTGG